MSVCGGMSSGIPPYRLRNEGPQVAWLIARFIRFLVTFRPGNGQAGIPLDLSVFLRAFVPSCLRGKNWFELEPGFH